MAFECQDFTVLAKMFTRKNMCKANGCLILVNMGMEDKSLNVPLSLIRFKMKNQILLSNFDKKWVAKMPYFLFKITKKNLVFHLKSDQGHIERFSFEVYMSPIPIFPKIKQPFALHIFFLVNIFASTVANQL